MAGHSKWATTKHKKAANDAKRGKLFAKLVKNVEVAARTGGGDPAGNPTLFDAIQKAKRSSVPNDNIDRAVKRGSGLEAGAADYETIIYEAYGPNGVAMLIECLTDNRNRAAMEVRTALTRNNGTLADPGSVQYLFARKGQVIVPKDGGATEDDLMEATLDAGAEEIEDGGEVFEITSEATDVVAVRTALQEAGIEYDSAEAAWVPSVTVELDVDGAKQMLRLIDALEDCDDVQNVFANMDASDEVLEAALGRVITVRILGVDPGLTRCGLGVVDAAGARRVSLVHVETATSPATDPVPIRLAALADAIDAVLDAHRPQAVALERVFAQHNVRTVMGTAQVSGVVMLAAARRDLPVVLYTPSEVKAAVTGHGRAEKAQVGFMVARVLGLSEVPRPADAADALAIAIAHAWRGGGAPAGSNATTAAQRRWAEAERASRTRG